MLIYRMLKKMKNPLCGYKRNVSGPILCTSSQKTHIHTHRTKDLITGHSNTNVKLALAANISAGALDFAVLRVFKWRMNSSEFKLKMLLYPYMRVIKHIHVTKAQIKVQNHLNLIYIYICRRQCQSAPVFLPGDSQGQRSLVGCRLWGCTESDMTEAIQQQQYIYIYIYIYISSWKITKPP